VFIDRLEDTSSLEDVRGVCAEICTHYGFDHFAYIGQILTSFTDPRYIYISGYPPGWWRRYKKNKYIEKDPLIHHCSEHVTPIYWEKAPTTAVDDTEVSKLMREARNYGLRNGLSIPVHSSKGDSAVLSFSMGREDSKVLTHIHKSTPDLYLLSAYTHEAAMRVVSGQGLSFKHKDLTSRERECLIWAAEGSTTWDIAKHVGVSESTVIFHLQNAMKKLGAANRQQAIAKAVVLGLITPGYK